MTEKDAFDNERASQPAARELRLRNRVFEGSSLPMVVMDCESWAFVDCNPAALAIYGFSCSEEVLGKTPMDMSSPTQYNGACSDVEARRHINDAIACGSAVFEWRHQRPDGTQWDAEVHLSRVDEYEPALLQFTLVDITERKRAAAALLESEILLSSTINSTKDHIWSVGLDDYRLLAFNRSFEQRFVRKGIQIRKGMTLDERYPDEADRKKWRAFYKRVVVDGNCATELYSDADERALELTPSLLKRESGVFGVSVFGRDVTEQTRAETGLRENQQTLTTLLSNVPGFVFRCRPDCHWTMLFLSAGCLMLTGYAPDELLDNRIMSYAAIIHRDDQERVASDTLAAIEQSRSWQSEYRIITKSGEEKWVWEQGCAAVENGEKLLAGIVIDITERKRAEEALRAARDFRETLIQASPAFIVAIDLKGNTILANESMLSTLGYSPEEVFGKSYLETFVPKSEWDSLSKVFHETSAENRKTLHANRVIKKNGQELTCEWQGIPILKNGVCEYFIGVGVDVTERIRAEEESRSLQAQLLQAQKMESIGRLAGGVAHDFNNMLGVILGATELLDCSLEDDSPLREELQVIRTATDRSIELSRQLLAFARKQAIAPKVLNLNETLKGMLKMLERLLGEEIKLVWRPSDPLGLVKVDPSQIDQVLANLCVNARDAIEGPGQVTIETDQVELDGAYCAEHLDRVPGEYIMIAVSDNGCGMSKEVRDRIFEPFYTTKGAGKGTGLGLATVWGIVKQNEGFIDVYSASGEGTTFRIFLPRHENDSHESRAPLSCRQAFEQGTTLLIVEDEESLLRVSRAMLERFGFVVLSASTPSEALKLAASYSGDIELLMTDVILPEMNGRVLFEELRARRPHLKCLFVSGYATDHVFRQGRLDANCAFLAKPFSMHTLSSKLGRLLSACD